MDKFSNAEKKFKKNGGYDWVNRRRIVYLTLVFCAFTITFIMFKGLDLSIYDTIVTGAFMLGASTIGTYVFGRTWENLSLAKTESIKEVAAMSRPESVRDKTPQDLTPTDES